MLHSVFNFGKRVTLVPFNQTQVSGEVTLDVLGNATPPWRVAVVAIARICRSLSTLR